MSAADLRRCLGCGGSGWSHGLVCENCDGRGRLGREVNASLAAQCAEVAAVAKRPRQSAGREAARAGASSEALVCAALVELRGLMVADIRKSPTPTRRVSASGAGVFGAVYAARGGADYVGTLAGGRSVAFELKSSAAPRISTAAVKAHQAEHLGLVSRMGGAAFVLLHWRGVEPGGLAWGAVLWCDWRLRKSWRREDARFVTRSPRDTLVAVCGELATLQDESWRR